MNFPASRAGKIISLIVAYFIIATPILHSCGGGGGGGDSGTGLPEDVIGTIQINTDPNDPMACQITGKNSGDRIVLYGDKDSDGVPLYIDALSYFLPGEDAPSIFHLDSEGRPELITSPKGEVISLAYSDDAVTFTLRDENGDEVVEEISLKGVDLPQPAPPSFASMQPASNPAGYPLIAATGDEKSISINGSVHMSFTTPGGTYIGDINTGKLSVKPQNVTDLVMYKPPFGGWYDFTIVHRIEDLEVEAEKCIEELASPGWSYYLSLHLAGTFALIMAIFVAIKARRSNQTPSILMSTVIPALLTIIGMIATYVGQKGSKALRCDYLKKKADVIAGEGKKSVAITASYGKSSKDLTVEYDLFDPTNPLLTGASFVRFVEFPLNTRILSISPSPGNPSVDESYMLQIGAVLPPEGKITCEASRTKEGYYKMFPDWVNGGLDVNVMPTFGPVAPADAEADDVITAKAFLKGNTDPSHTLTRVIKISGDTSTTTGPEGTWTVKHWEYDFINDKCEDTKYPDIGGWIIKSDHTWEKTTFSGGYCETDEKSTWELVGNKITLKAKISLFVSKGKMEYRPCTYEGTVVYDSNHRITKIEKGKEWYTIPYPYTKKVEYCWVAEKAQ